MWGNRHSLHIEGRVMNTKHYKVTIGIHNSNSAVPLHLHNWELEALSPEHAVVIALTKWSCKQPKVELHDGHSLVIQVNRASKEKS